MQFLILLLNEHAKVNYEIKVLHNEQIKIQLKFFKVYSITIKQLEIKQTKVYTYKHK